MLSKEKHLPVIKEDELQKQTTNPKTTITAAAATKPIINFKEKPCCYIHRLKLLWTWQLWSSVFAAGEWLS